MVMSHATATQESHDFNRGRCQISTDYDVGNDGVPFADLLPEERINAAAYYVEEHLKDWTTLLSFTVPYARYTDVPNAK